ncbi:arginine/serine-rich protein PNISR-like [Stegastes partitus]|uniref:Arginine/serine-rich protein PNISR-like n=1 Tax=Stegastes partitus TaxID=144197 RepID=A0A9Y4NC09_9TELE|nr:PREDICTED: arginine/serine-rich protein PNISR-like [Stegastes partitus]XP_008292529.1 PREDICTED: arginine/serine-rich protein PNISR-like [Stegastes partitus]XP_008292530.1 PREDICTED: arginine/serine-rich protein PNISR-like [Stegastes partitus]
MNPHEWKDAIQRLQRHFEPNHQSAVSNNVGNTSTSSNNWDAFCEYSTRYGALEPHGSNVGWTELGPPSGSDYRRSSEVEELDGGELEMNEQDKELVRKRQQLREIEERIIHKKASIALKTVGQLENNTTAGVSCDAETLRDRVNVILQQRCPLGFLSKVRSHKDRTNSSSLSKEGLLQQQHPLKLRVEALMTQRRSDACIQAANRDKTPEATLPPPSRSLASPAEEDNSVNKGFERFLSILNKGVDMDMLSRIVTADREDLPLRRERLNVQSSDVDKKSDSVFSSESRRSDSRTNSSEAKTEPLAERLSLPDVEEKKNARGHNSRSKSPPVAKKKMKKKKKEEEEAKPKVDEKQEQLQNILRTLGLNLDADEMNKLTDRTQERLYGKKAEGRWRTGEEESRQRGSNRDSSTSSSSSSSSSSLSSSSSSRSSSRSFSRSPSPRQRQDGGHGSEEAQEDPNRFGMNSQQIYTYQHPLNQTFPLPHPAASAYPGYNQSQYYHYTNNHSVTYSAATHSLWPQMAFHYPNYSYPVVPVQDATSYHHRSLENFIPYENELATIEGQEATASRPRCLKAVKLKEVQLKREPCLKQLVAGPRKKRKKKNPPSKRARIKRKKQRQKMAQQKEADKAKDLQDGESDGDDSNISQSDEEKPELTEQEIKAKLRKTLEAFNQKAKHTSQLPQPTLMQPANSLTSENG